MNNGSAFSAEMDLLFFFIVGACAFFAILVIALIVVFAVKYPRRRPEAVDADIHGPLFLELAWTLIPFVLAIAILGWGAAMFFKLATPPANAMTRSGRMTFLIIRTAILPEPLGRLKPY